MSTRHIPFSSSLYCSFIFWKVTWSKQSRHEKNSMANPDQINIDPLTARHVKFLKIQLDIQEGLFDQHSDLVRDEKPLFIQVQRQ